MELSARQLHHRPPPSVKQEQDDDSDAEEVSLGLRRTENGLESQIIHSGHFMVSSPHSEHPPKKGYDFDTVNKQTCQTYHFGKASTSHISIDASLTKLFECMTLAYSGELVSPKWKNFKGLKLLWRDKIRLNNAIWRAWYMQYVERRKNPVCHFVTPLHGNVDLEHRSTEMITTEGKCWRRRIEIVIREYHKWRTYFKKRLQKHKDDDLSSLLKGPKEQLSLFGEVPPAMHRVSLYQDEESEVPPPMDLESLFDMEVLISEVSDTLFSTFHQPMAWPSPKEPTYAGNADMIQPRLNPLQPNLDFMEDSSDPLQDLFHSYRQPVFPSVSPTAPSVPPLPSSSSQSQVQLMSSMQLPVSPLAIPSPLTCQTSGASDGGDGAIVENYLPLYPGQVALGNHVAVSTHNPLVSQCLPIHDVGAPPLDETLAPSAIAHSSTAGASSACTQAAPAPSRPPSLNELTAPAVQPQQMFAVPVRLQPTGTPKKRVLKKISPAKPLTPPQLYFTAVIPTMKADATPPPTVMIAACGIPVVPQTQKSSQHMAPSENRKQESPSSVVQGQPGSGQGSPCSFDQVPSPQSLISSSTTPQSQRRAHQAEQNRRLMNCRYKMLCSLVPTLNSKSPTNAVTIQKTVEHIEKLKQEREEMQMEIRKLQEEIADLNASISLCHDQLPESGALITQEYFEHIQYKFNEYVKRRTRQNWKFWIFSIIIKPLFESFNKMVSTTSRAELGKTTLEWLERHCSLMALRPMVRSTLCHLSTSTSILSDPSLLPEEAIQAITCADVSPPPQAR
ncbi:MLX-interacting protein isoform X2 [Dunckerocampus dactyliophorus]|uniref:MLX-interacting protein isoform X2 n=1 Tax=Dunckerocampus dactyliophorus TaxID=161453 RepID=UPI002405C351|nr:MLX-interacting protein isoform X2 [Dunckerocampus dactyliophorus]